MKYKNPDHDMCCPFRIYDYKYSYRPDNSYQPLTVSTIKLSNSNDKIIENIQIPVFQDGIDPGILEKLNRNIKADIMEFKEQMETAADEYAEKLKKLGRKPNPYKISTTYSVTYNKNNILSISLFFQEYISGRNSYIRTTYNYDLRTGESIPLKRLFKPGVNYLSALNRKAGEYLQAYSPATLSQFKGIREDQPYYLDSNSLVLFPAFNEIAGAAADIPVIRLPLTSLSNILNSRLLDNY